MRSREAVVEALASMEPGELAAVVAEALQRQGGEVKVAASLEYHFTVGGDLEGQVEDCMRVRIGATTRHDPDCHCAWCEEAWEPERDRWRPHTRKEATTLAEVDARARMELRILEAESREDDMIADLLDALT